MLGGRRGEGGAEIKLGVQKIRESRKELGRDKMGCRRSETHFVGFNIPGFSISLGEVKAVFAVA